MSELRVYSLLNDIGRVLENLNKEELIGANSVLGILSYYLTKTHFEEQKEIDVKALVKTIEELDEISIELLLHKHKAQDLFVKAEKND